MCSDGRVFGTDETSGSSEAANAGKVLTRGLILVVCSDASHPYITRGCDCYPLSVLGSPTVLSCEVLEQALILLSHHLGLGHDGLGMHPIVLVRIEGRRPDGTTVMVGALPVYLLVEWVIFDIQRAVAQVPESPRDVLLQELSDEVFGIGIDVGRVVDSPVKDLLVRLQRLLCLKRRVAVEHLVEEDAQRPVVDRLPMALLEDDFGRQVLWRAAESPGAVLDQLGKAKVCQLQSAVLGEQQVLELEIPVDDAHAVQVLKRQQHLHDEDAGVREREGLVLVQLVEHVAARTELHDEDQVGLRDDGAELVRDERVNNARQDLRLLHDVLDLAHGDDVSFHHLLERVDLPRLLVNTPPHLTKGALAKRVLGHVEVLQNQRTRRFLEGEVRRNLADAGRVCAVALAPGFVVRHLDAARRVLAQREQRVERAEQPLERPSVHPDHLARVGGDHGRYRRGARLQRELAKVVSARAARENRRLAALSNHNLSLDDDVEVRPRFPLLDDLLVNLVRNLLERVDHPIALVLGQRLE
mmetsp:Transcript_39142/g.86039  ORF Transcript_39142/g.86039 Transcript_39142/m.86039 type:complete len:527 (+) Transcript_39142:133-1713(+)